MYVNGPLELTPTSICCHALIQIARITRNSQTKWGGLAVTFLPRGRTGLLVATRSVLRHVLTVILAESHHRGAARHHLRTALLTADGLSSILEHLFTSLLVLEILNQHLHLPLGLPQFLHLPAAAAFFAGAFANGIFLLAIINLPSPLHLVGPICRRQLALGNVRSVSSLERLTPLSVCIRLAGLLGGTTDPLLTKSNQLHC